MIEYEGQDGGRFTYIDDIVNLQNLALAFNSIFDGCGNFIISGCEINGTDIGSGYVYINGKIRRFNGASNITFPLYIYESNRAENVTYADTNSKIGRKIYSCAFGAAVPTVNDELTGMVPQAITITATSAPRINEAFFGKYALMINPPRTVQTVENKVNFNGAITFAEGFSSSKALEILNALGAFKADYDSAGNLKFQSTATGKGTSKFVIGGDGVFRFYNGTTLCAEISESSINLNGHSLVGNKLQGGNLSISSSEISNTSIGTDAGSVDINKSGYNGGTNYFRDFNVYNGKGALLFQICGIKEQATLNTGLNLVSGNEVGLALRTSLYDKTNVALKKLIYWQDKSEENISYVGYDLITDNVFRIKNNIGNIEICPSENLNVVGAIKENGKLLSEKYLSVESANTKFTEKADSKLVYSKNDSDIRYLQIATGLVPAIDYLASKGDTDAKKTLRNQIDAVSQTDTDKLYITQTKYLSDIATDDSKKKQICSNIGAAYSAETQSKLKDSGWKQIQSPGLYIRQIGNIVTIQGTINIVSGLIGNIPNEIDVPTYSCGKVAETDMNDNHSNDRGAFVEIAAGSRDFKCTRNTVDSKNLPFSLTYMV